MKRAIVFVLVLSMLFCLFGCSKSDNAETTSQDNTLSIGSTLKLPFAEITFEKFYKTQKFIPQDTDTSKSYSYLSAKDGKTLVVLQGLIKNTSKEAFGSTDIKTTLDFDGKTYSAQLGSVLLDSKEDHDVSSFNELPASGECRIYFLVEVPTAETENIHSGTMTIQFDENFGRERSNEYDYTYKINVSE